MKESGADELREKAELQEALVRCIECMSSPYTLAVLVLAFSLLQAAVRQMWLKSAVLAVCAASPEQRLGVCGTTAHRVHSAAAAAVFLGVTHMLCVFGCL